jgi:hypothetical protein
MVLRSSQSNKNEYQEYFLSGEGGRCVGLTTLPPSRADCLNLLEPLGPVQACNGIAFTHHYKYKRIFYGQVAGICKCGNEYSGSIFLTG